MKSITCTEKNLAVNMQVVLTLPKFSICFVITKREDLKTMLKQHNSTHSSIYPTSPNVFGIRIKRSVGSCEMYVYSDTSDQLYNLFRTNYQINFTSFLQAWGLSMTSNLGSSNLKSGNVFMSALPYICLSLKSSLSKSC